MKDNSLIYNNSLLSIKDFIDAILYTEPKEQLPICELTENPEFYYIDINSFSSDKHILEISYENNSLILKILSNDDIKKFLFQRIYYLSNINLNNILLHDYGNSMRLIIAKIS